MKTTHANTSRHDRPMEVWAPYTSLHHQTIATGFRRCHSITDAGSLRSGLLHSGDRPRLDRRAWKRPQRANDLHFRRLFEDGSFLENRIFFSKDLGDQSKRRGLYK